MTIEAERPADLAGSLSCRVGEVRWRQDVPPDVKEVLIANIHAEAEASGPVVLRPTG